MGGPGPLVDLPNREKLSPTVTRILGQNPSLYTLQGTNTYLLQPSNSPSAPIILIDTTMPTTADAWVAQVMEHLNSLASPPPPIEHLVITHRHIDHVGGLEPLLTALQKANLPPIKVWKNPNPDEDRLQKSDRDMDVYSTDAAIAQRLSSVPGAVTPFAPGIPVHPLEDGTHVSVEHNGETVGVTVVPTPGHTADSISLLIDGPEKAVITGDTILGQGTTIFMDFAAYMKSLKTLKAIEPTILYPAHGPQILGREACDAHISTYIKHREERENTIIRALQLLKREPGTLGTKLDAIRAAAAEQARAGEGTDSGRVPGAGADAHKAAGVAALNSAPISEHFSTSGETASAATVPLLVRLVYSTGHEGLIMAASRTVKSHLDKLEGEGRARRIHTPFPRIKDWIVEEVEDAEAWEWVGEMPQAAAA